MSLALYSWLCIRLKIKTESGLTWIGNCLDHVDMDSCCNKPRALFLAVLTTKAVMAGALFLLSHFPEIQEKIREEIINIVGSRSPTTEDMASMPYTEACMMEILRYQSHLPLTAPHANLSQEVELEGYTIPKGTVVST